GVQKSERDYLGRWSPDGSDDYLRTSRQVVLAVQGLVAQGIRDSFVPGGLDLEEVLGDNGLYEFLVDRGVAFDQARECVQGFTVRRVEASPGEDFVGSERPASWLGEVLPKVAVDYEVE
ncbi:unnamed protein product, partial [Polarella glacialis]